MFYSNEVRPAPHLELTSEFSDKELSMERRQSERRKQRPRA